MDKLKEVIKNHGNWSALITFVERIETHVEIDFSHSLENSKALLETIGKEICNRNKVELGNNPSINSVLKKAFTSIGYTNSSLVNQISSALSTIGQQIGELRNKIGVTSHGKILEEIKIRNDKVDILTRDFLIDTVELISVFLIRNFEAQSNKTMNQSLEDTLEYIDAEEFNESWDYSFGEFLMGDYSYLASEILFNVDKQAYINEYKNFLERGE